MDRNVFNSVMLVFSFSSVATREGGVDRNITPTLEAALPTCVATREGGVDRNVTSEYNFALHLSSPPARVAWIETKPA